MTTRKLLAALVCALPIALSACGSAGSSAPTPTAASAPAAASEPAASAPTAASEPTAASAEQAETALEDLDSGLEGLQSYRLSFTATFEGTENGEVKQGSLEYAQEYISESGDQRFSVTSQGAWAESAGAGQNHFEMLRVGDTSYMYMPEQTDGEKCISFSADSQEQGPVVDAFKPEAIIGGIEKARLIGRGETVNGVKTDHYEVIEGGISLAGAAGSKGEAWIATDGGYLVKYIGTFSGNGLLFAPNSEGTMTWEYSLTDVDQVDAITLPEDCAGQQAAADIPIPEGATEKSSFGGMQSFKTAEAPAAVADFYKRELAGQGWTAGQENAMEGMAILEFTKGARQLTVTVTQEEAGSMVMLVEEKGD